MIVAYISGPISGKPNLNHPAFFAAEEKLKAAGYEVFNPVRHPAGLTEAAYMQLAMVALPLSNASVCALESMQVASPLQIVSPAALNSWAIQ